MLMILDSRTIKYDVVDIAEPGNEEQKDFMQNNSTSLGATVSDTNPRHPLPPQIFNDDLYCGVCNIITCITYFTKLLYDESCIDDSYIWYGMILYVYYINHIFSNALYIFNRIMTNLIWQMKLMN